MKKVILVICDGWGIRKDSDHNAILNTSTPNFDKLMKEYPHCSLNASGEAVGLPRGYQGNSEVGHLTIGSGRIINQSLKKINESIKDKSFFKKKEFLDAINNCKRHSSKLHLIGLLQKEGVHSHMKHLFALLDLCKKEKFNDVYIHVITDGRDSPVKNGINYVKDLQEKLDSVGFGKIVSICGRYYAMDRNNRWERTRKAYDCIVEGKCRAIFNGDVAVELKKYYKQRIGDEFIVPHKLREYKGIQKNDSVIFYNFRTDRTRQLTKAIVEKRFNEWNRKFIGCFFVAMTDFYKPMNGVVAFKEESIKNLLGEVISDKGLKQLRISETEKYAHVTFFFNGQNESAFKGESRIMIPSPNVKTYDLKPEMSIYEVSDKLINEIRKKEFNFIVVNLVNGDMVGHTGVGSAIRKAVASVDECVGKIVNAGIENEYTVLVSADHGNAEDQTKENRTNHTTNKVPFVCVGAGDVKLKNGGLQDIAPSVLDLLKIKKPKEMSGNSLIC